MSRNELLRGSREMHPTKPISHKRRPHTWRHRPHVRRLTDVHVLGCLLQGKRANNVTLPPRCHTYSGFMHGCTAEPQKCYSYTFQISSHTLLGFQFPSVKGSSPFLFEHWNYTWFAVAGMLWPKQNDWLLRNMPWHNLLPRSTSPSIYVWQVRQYK